MKKPVNRNEEFIISKGDYNLIDIIRKKSDYMNNEKIFISTWSIGNREIHSLKSISESSELKLLIDISFMNRSNSDWELLLSEIGHLTYVTKNHTKIAIIQSELYDYVILSSANLNKNLRLEFFYIVDDKSLAEQILNDFNPYLKTPVSDMKNISRNAVNTMYNRSLISRNYDELPDIDFTLPDIDFTPPLFRVQSKQL